MNDVAANVVRFGVGIRREFTGVMPLYQPRQHCCSPARLKLHAFCMAQQLCSARLLGTAAVADCDSRRCQRVECLLGTSPYLAYPAVSTHATSLRASSNMQRLMGA